MKILLYILGAFGLSGIAYYIYTKYYAQPTANGTAQSSTSNVTVAPLLSGDALNTYVNASALPLTRNIMTAAKGSTAATAPVSNSLTANVKSTTPVSSNSPVAGKGNVLNMTPQPPAKQGYATVANQAAAASTKPTTNALVDAAPVSGITTAPATKTTSGGLTHTTITKPVIKAA